MLNVRRSSTSRSCCHLDLKSRRTFQSAVESVQSASCIQRLRLGHVPRDVVHLDVKDRVVVRFNGRASRYVHRFPLRLSLPRQGRRPIKQITVELLGARGIAATDFEVNDGIWHFDILELTTDNCKLVRTACTNSLCDQLVRSWLVRSWRSKDCNFRCGQHRCGITGITGRTTEIESRRRSPRK